MYDTQWVSLERLITYYEDDILFSPTEVVVKGQPGKRSTPASVCPFCPVRGTLEIQTAGEHPQMYCTYRGVLGDAIDYIVRREDCTRFQASTVLLRIHAHVEKPPTLLERVLLADIPDETDLPPQAMLFYGYVQTKEERASFVDTLNHWTRVNQYKSMLHCVSGECGTEGNLCYYVAIEESLQESEDLLVLPSRSLRNHDTWLGFLLAYAERYGLDVSKKKPSWWLGLLNYGKEEEHG